jgi:hypothetical protein
MEKNYIIIDCAPAKQRPDEILKSILVDTGLTEEDFENTCKSFGAWTFRLRDKESIFLEKFEIIIAKLKTCYHNGLIRYAEYDCNDILV